MIGLKLEGQKGGDQSLADEIEGDLNQSVRADMGDQTRIVFERAVIHPDPFTDIVFHSQHHRIQQHSEIRKMRQDL